MPSVTCPTCLTVFRTLEEWSPSEPVICVNCDRRIWLGYDSRTADRPSSTFWDHLPIAQLLVEVAPALPPASGAAPPAVDPPSAVSEPTTPPPSRGFRFAVNA